MFYKGQVSRTAVLESRNPLSNLFVILTPWYLIPKIKRASKKLKFKGFVVIQAKISSPKTPLIIIYLIDFCVCTTLRMVLNIYICMCLKNISNKYKTYYFIIIIKNQINYFSLLLIDRVIHQLKKFIHLFLLHKIV